MTLNELFKFLSVDFIVKVIDWRGDEVSGMELLEGKWMQEISEIRPDGDKLRGIVVVLK